MLEQLIRVVLGAGIAALGVLLSLAMRVAWGWQGDAARLGINFVFASALCVVVSASCIGLVRCLLGAYMSRLGVPIGAGAALVSFVAGYLALLGLVAVFALLDESGEVLMWLPVLLFIEIPRMLPIVVSAVLGAFVVVGDSRSGAGRG